MGRGGNGMMKFGDSGVGRGSPGRKKKRKIGRPPLKKGNPNWGNKNDTANVNLAGAPSPRKRGRPPSKNLPVFNPESAEISAPSV